jgi:hypothetical protein
LLRRTLVLSIHYAAVKRSTLTFHGIFIKTAKAISYLLNAGSKGFDEAFLVRLRTQATLYRFLYVFYFHQPFFFKPVS